MENRLEKIKAFRKIVWLIVAIFALQLPLLLTHIPVKTIGAWGGGGVLAIVFIYLVVLCLRLLRELQQREEEI
ncbi:MAG: hypothetical protein LBU80_07580 [Rikenellaceae bacterium]|jgi:hypothetical protein|nr:hypothetical protein [Rikenellaceae bacterium]